VQLPGKTVSEMAYTVSSGTLALHAHSLIVSHSVFFIQTAAL